MTTPIEDAALRIAAAALPNLVTWAAKKLEGGGDPQADLDALMSTEEVGAIELERAKFPEPPP